MRRPAAALLLVLAAAGAPGVLALSPAPASPAKNVSPGKDVAPGKDAPAPESWVRQVHAIVVRSMTSLSGTLPRGDYVVHFSIDEEGRGSRYGVEGNVGAAQAAVITAALAARSFPAPADGASHAMSFTVRMK